MRRTIDRLVTMSGYDAAMQKLFLALVIALGIGVGLSWSGPGTETESGPLKEVVIDRSDDGHFYADVLLNGHSIRFLVDTGAGAVALTEEDAKLAGFEIDPAEFRSIGEGPSGLVRGTFVTPHSMKLGEFAPPDLKAAVVQGASVSLLGQPFLDKLDEIVIRKDVMILRYS